MNFPLTIAEKKDFDVVGFGTNAVDFLISVPHYPEFNSKVELSGYTQAAGGEVATTMAGLRRLGLKTAYVGRFGDDPAGEIGRRSLIDEGVDMTYAETVAGAKTQIAFIVIDEKSGERTVIWQRDRLLAYTADEAPLGVATRARVLHLTPHDAEACLTMAKAARAAGTLVSIDIDNLLDGVGELLRYVDIFISSADFPAKLTGISDLKSALTEIQKRFGCAISGATLGEAGSLMLADDRFIETPGFAVPGGCLDTTGAGDAFRVGLLFGLLTGQPVETAAKFANAVAALKCRSIGARTSLPTREELLSLLK